MTKFKDITCHKFGRLTALYRIHNKKGRTKWLCVCDCCNFKEVAIHELHNGKTQTIAKWSRELNIPTYKLYYRHNIGLSDKECLFGR